MNVSGGFICSGSRLVTFLQPRRNVVALRDKLAGLDAGSASMWPCSWFSSSRSAVRISYGILLSDFLDWNACSRNFRISRKNAQKIGRVYICYSI